MRGPHRLAEQCHVAQVELRDESLYGAAHGGVAVLVNNAGFELAGPIEEVPPAEARRGTKDPLLAPAVGPDGIDDRNAHRMRF